MASSVSNELTNMQNATAYNKAQEQKESGASQELDQDAFLMLMIEQLKNQDPMNPMDNSEMLAQQAQFTQISELQKLNSAMNSNNMIQQANSLVGKTVQIVDPNNTSRLIIGVVTSANFTSDSATVTVNGVEYPLGLVSAVTDGAQATDSSTLGNKKLSELNNASITEGYVTLTMQDTSGKKTNVAINITKDMTVNDFMKKIEEAGLKTTLENGIITIDKGGYRQISMSNGHYNNNAAVSSNLVGAMKMFQAENGDLETGVLDFDRSQK